MLLNRALVGYQWVSIFLTFLAFALAGWIFYQGTRGPIVVREQLGRKEFYEGHPEPLRLTDEDVKSVIEQWIRLRYDWSELDPEEIARSIGPLSTEGLQAKIRELLSKQKAHSPPEQRLAEAVSGIEVSLGEHDAEASFDLILRVNGIPLVVPMQVSFQVEKGTPTRWNPTGLWVNGVVEQEQK